MAKGSLLSVDSDRKRNKKKNWPLHNFKWGLEEYDSEDLRLEGLPDGDFRVLGGGDDGVGCLKKFSVDSIRKPFVGVAPAFSPAPDTIRYTHKASSSVGRRDRLDSLLSARGPTMPTCF